MSEKGENRTNASNEIILKMYGICKYYPGVKALDQVQFELEKGEIHAIMGENGAGKSTFIKVITGVNETDGGTIELRGEKIVFNGPKDAQNHNIAAIYQHGTMYPYLSITENIFMNHEVTMGPIKTINWKILHEKASELLKKLGSDLDPHTSMNSLTVAEQQVVEVAKAISQNADILIMDEPTASLSKRECENLYAITEKLRDEGVSIIFISHRFEDMYRLASRVTVLRDGKYIGTWKVGEISSRDLISAMVGREIDNVYPTKETGVGEALLRVENLSKLGYYKDINFTLKKGEILGFAGLVGAGRTDVMEGIFGIHRPDSGKTYLNGKGLKIKKPLDALKQGIGLLPEDRQKQGLFLDWDIYKNITISDLNAFSKLSILDNKTERKRAKKLGEKIALKTPTVFDKVNSLSGGNQQKVVICKLLNLDLKVLILDEPTKGVDVGAKSQIYEIMNDLAAQGYGIIMVSSDMPELLGMCDRIITMCDGKITGEVLREHASQENILEKSISKSDRKSDDNPAKGAVS